MYDYLIFDTVNFAYKCTTEEDRVQPPRPHSLLKIGKRTILKNLFKRMLHTSKMLESKFLKPEGSLLFLFDNYTSREELKASLIPADTHSSRKKINPYYKSTRKVATYEFYATLDLFHYYLKLKEEKYQSARIPHLEADDLLPTAVDVIGKDKKILTISSDSDWCKVLSVNVQTLPDLYGEPFTIEDFYAKNGYFPTEDHIKLEKMLFGDDADNVKSVFTELSKDEKLYALSKWDNIVDFLYDSQSDERLSKHKFSFKDKEPEIKLAYKMLSTIPVSESHFKAVWLKGRNALRLPIIIEQAVESEVSSDATNNSFTFGELQVPRKVPVDQEYHSDYMLDWKRKGEKE